MTCKLIIIFLLLLHNKSLHSTAQTWIKSGYWLTVNEFPVTDIDSSLFTHLFCAFASLNSSTFRLSIPSRDEDYFSSFATTVKLKNPSVLTLLSIGDSSIAPIFFSMLSNSSFRKSFIDSSVKTARRYGFDGIDLCCLYQRNTSSNMKDMGTLFEEWRAAVDSEARSNSGGAKLILTIALYYLPEDFPVNSIQRSFDWVHIMAFDYYVPLRDKFVHPHAALYDPFSNVSTDYGIREWINKGLSVGKMVLGLPYHGYAWTLMNPKNKMIGAPSSGPAITPDGSMSYNYIKEYVHSYGAVILYNSTYVENYCTFGSFWIGFDDVETIKTKVSYVKEKGLLGYTVFQVGNDDNWVLSKAAAGKA
ncbi:hypothetical protein Nepgr_006314 [Nepenthes gracilis]|uniref:GH18 domain-containing protein n=1 Tax=Nepenthes gracilis TaxID=150966 RepID=A0AAD3S5A5_NEPGR|nr:hypothetical protein Nepgr_006314 [Nepenthes gracilis]